MIQYCANWIYKLYTTKCFKLGLMPLEPNMVKVQFQNSPSYIDRLHQILAFAHIRTHTFSLMVNIFPTHTKNIVLQDIFKNRCNIKIAPRLLLMMMLLVLLWGDVISHRPWTPICSAPKVNKYDVTFKVSLSLYIYNYLFRFLKSRQKSTASVAE